MDVSPWVRFNGNRKTRMGYRSTIHAPQYAL
jgi:hypothetical protein